MNEGIGNFPPELTTQPNLGAVEHRVVERAGVTDRKKKGGKNCASDVDAHQDRRDIDRITPHPRYRSVIIGGSDSEHAAIKQPRLCSRKQKENHE